MTGGTSAGAGRVGDDEGDARAIASSGTWGGVSKEVAVGVVLVAVTTLLLVAHWWRQRQRQRHERDASGNRDAARARARARAGPRQVPPHLSSQQGKGAEQEGDEVEARGEEQEPQDAKNQEKHAPPRASERQAQAHSSMAPAPSQPPNDTVYFIQPSSHPAFVPECGPIKSLEDLLAFREGSEFCRARVPLQTRCAIPKGPRMLVCHDMMGGYKQDHHPQGLDEPNIFMLQHWHLMDTFVYFAHELVSLPPPGWTNTAHLHGVNVLGTFITEWDKGRNTCATLLQDEATRQLTAEKLALVMAFHRFDGWLINIENEVEDVTALKDFVRRVRKECHKQNAGAVVLWYDAVTTEGRLQWQDELNTRNTPFFAASDGIFLNYTWTPSHLHRSLTTATAMKTAPAAPSTTTRADDDNSGGDGVRYGRAKGPRDVFAGIDVFGRNTYGGGKMTCGKAVDAIKDANLSIALFAPGWTYECRAPGTAFLEHNLKFWSQFESRLTPRRVGPVAVFASHLSLPRGDALFIAGRRVSGPWSDLAMQDALPSHPMTPSATNPFPLPPAKPTAFQHARMEFEERVAFCGGSCVRLSCGTGPDWRAGDGVVFRLFHTNVSLSRPLLIGVTLGTTSEDTTPPDACLQFVLSREHEGAVRYLRFPTRTHDKQHAFRFRDAAAAEKLQARFGLSASQYARKGDGTLTFAPISLRCSDSDSGSGGSGSGGGDKHKDDDENDGEDVNGRKRQSEAQEQTGDFATDAKRWQRDLQIPPSVIRGSDDRGDGSMRDGENVTWFTTWFLVAERDVSHQSISEIRLILRPRAKETTTRVLLGGVYALPPSLLNKCCTRVHGLRVSHVDWHDITRGGGGASLHLTLSWADADVQTIRYYRVFAAAIHAGSGDRAAAGHREDARRADAADDDDDASRAVYIGTAHVPSFRVCGIDPRTPSRPSTTSTTTSSTARSASGDEGKRRAGVVRFWVQPVGYTGLFPRLSACAHVDVKWAARR